MPNPGTLTAGVPLQRYEVRYQPYQEDWQGIMAAVEKRAGAVAFPWVVWDRLQEREEARCTTRRAAQREAHELNVSAGWKRGYRLVTAEERSPWAEALQVYREATDATQEDCAHRLGVSLSAWVKWEHGARQPSAYVRKRLADMLREAEVDVPGLGRTATDDYELPLEEGPEDDS